jgi:hypothetical protein
MYIYMYIYIYIYIYAYIYILLPPLSNPYSHLGDAARDAVAAEAHSCRCSRQGLMPL